MVDKQANNGRVTLALLGQKLDNIEDLLKRKCDEQDKDHDAISDIKGEIKVLKTRVSAWAGIQAAISAALAAALGYVSSRP